MTTMDSDSESQDSDDGRRFRFEATRKDAEKLPKLTGGLKDNLRIHENTTHRDKVEKSRYENDYKESGKRRNTCSRECNEEDKDSRPNTKYPKHTSESRTSRREDSKSSHSDSKRLKDRTRDSYHRRSHERVYSRDKNHEEKSIDVKYRTKLHDRDKHRSRHKSRDRSSQSNRTRSDIDAMRDSHRKQDYDRKSKKDSQPKSAKNSPTHSVEGNLSIDDQYYKNVDLSQFDVLSETDDNLSDGVGSENSISQSNKANAHSISSNQSEISTISIGNKGCDDQNWDKPHKVNPWNSSSLAGSSGNNPSAISDFRLNSTLSAVMSETTNDKKGKSRHSLRSKTNNAFNKEKEVDCSGEAFKSHSLNTSTEGMNIPGEDSADMDCSAYGPVLPPRFNKHSNTQCTNMLESEGDDSNSKISTNSNENSVSVKKRLIGPTIPSGVQILQYNTSLQDQERDTESPDDGDSTFGPTLPPHLLKQPEPSPNLHTKIPGPMLPNSIKQLTNEEADIKLSESDDEGGIGPLPMDHPAMKNNCIYEQLEERARRLKEELQEVTEEDVSKREEWMTELPPAQSVNLGLGPRKFRARPGPDMTDRSCWTDVPGKKSKHKKEQDDKKVFAKNELPKIILDDEEQKHKKQEKSLLEIHQEKIQKKRKKEEKKAKLLDKPVRRPFDRDIDLQANRFDQAQKKTILMKAQLLDDRFSRGAM